jgi:hypothetical protein
MYIVDMKSMDKIIPGTIPEINSFPIERLVVRA